MTNPRVRVRATWPAYNHAHDLLYAIMRGAVKLGIDPGSEYSEVVAGKKFIAYRLRCGGVEVREGNI